MSFISITTADLNEDKAITSTVLSKIMNNMGWVREAYQYNITQIPNRDFEYVTDGIPDMWDETTFENGYVGISSATAASGHRSVLLIHDGGTGNGGELLSDYIPVSTLHGNGSVVLYWKKWGDDGPGSNPQIRFYNTALTVLSTVGAFSTAGYTSPTVIFDSFTIPEGSRWMKIKVSLNTASTVSGTVHIDDLYINT